MKQFILIAILLLSVAIAKAQKVYSVDYENQADVKVFVVQYENQADLNVYKVKYENQADLKIYFVQYENQAGWKKNSKMSLMY